MSGNQNKVIDFKFNKPSRKKRVFVTQESPFPVPIATLTKQRTSNQGWYYYRGQLEGNTVVIKHSGDIDYLYRMGFFGKGTLSRLQPNYNTWFRKATVVENTQETSTKEENQICEPKDKTTGEERVNTNISGEERVKAGISREETLKTDYAGRTKDLRIMNKRKYLRRCAWRNQKETLQSYVSDLELNIGADGECDLEYARGVGPKSEETEGNGGNIVSIKRQKLETDDSKSPEMNIDNSGDCKEILDSKQEEVVVDRNFCSKVDSSHIDDSDITDSWANSNEKVSEDFWDVSSAIKTEESDSWGNSDTKTSEEFLSLPEPSVKNPKSEKINNLTNVDISNRDIGNDSSETKLISDTESFPTSDSTLTHKDNPQLGNQNLVTDLESITTTHMTPMEEGTDKHETDAPCEIDDTDEHDTISNEHNQPIHDYVINHRCNYEDKDGNLLVVENSDESDNELGTEEKPFWEAVRKRDPYHIEEHVHLTLEEAFFLSYGLGCLVVHDEQQKPLDVTTMWQIFCKRQPSFLANYIVYHNFRSKGWCPKPGIKYGAEYVVYKQGPPFYHSSYSVLVRLVDGVSFRDDTQYEKRPLSWTTIAGMHRITEQVSKEVMFCYVIKPPGVSDQDLTSSPAYIPQFKVQETIFRRWKSSAERENKHPDEIP
ncbi:unnamed protein product [Owenia fusiformis]|uniref:tRNA-intron lyase n=1 Tax=Owenia fusiformis TaxID=6347 RepID=A0A8S4MYN0_OWEFU|nr:unnamed protein product [Owenia fusiformis]